MLRRPSIVLTAVMIFQLPNQPFRPTASLLSLLPTTTATSFIWFGEIHGSRNRMESIAEVYVAPLSVLAILMPYFLSIAKRLDFMKQYLMNPACLMDFRPENHSEEYCSESLRKMKELSAGCLVISTSS